MKQNALAKWLKGIIIGMGLCGLLVYGYIFPSMVDEVIAYGGPIFENYAVPWKIFIGLTALPCYGVLICGWQIAKHIGEDRSFSKDNAVLLQRISQLALGDSAFFFIGNIVLWAMNRNHPGVVLASLLVVFAGVVIAVAAAALSHLVYKASELQEDQDLTI